MTKAKLILINGFNASGKTTIAKKYIAEHSLAIDIEADALVDNMGDWTNHRDEAGALAFTLTKAMIRAYLPSGHDVVLPYIVTIGEEAEQFETIARDCDADFYEIVLHNDRPDAIARLLERGKWGGETSPLITDADMPLIEEDFRKMEAVLENRPQAKKLPLKGLDPESTYRQLLRLIEE